MKSKPMTLQDHAKHLPTLSELLAERAKRHTVTIDPSILESVRKANEPIDEIYRRTREDPR